MASTTTRRRGAKAKPAPEPEIDEIEDLEEDEVEEVEEKPRKRSAKKATAKTDENVDGKKASARKEVTNGTQWLAEHVNKLLGTEYKAYDLRVILRKMAKDGTLDREVGEDRSRYDFEGPKDPVVLALVKKLKAGDLEKDRREKLAALKDKKAKGKKAKAKSEDDDEVGEELADEEEEEDLEDE